MKKVFLLIIAFTITYAITAQQSAHHKISFGVDIANAMYGSDYNDKALNYKVAYTYKSFYKDNKFADDEVGFIYESFKEIKYEHFGLFFNRVLYPRISNTELALGIEGLVIHRDVFNLNDDGKLHSYWWSYGLNFEPRWNVTDNLQLSFVANIKRRTDIQRWKLNNELRISLRF